MLRKVIEYKDFNGTLRKEAFWFHLMESEIAEMELSTTGGFTEALTKIVEAQDTPAIIKQFKGIILKAYGKKSPDGRRFEKSEELSREFSQTNAYSTLFMELATNEAAASEFINGIVPDDYKQSATDTPALEVVEDDVK